MLGGDVWVGPRVPNTCSRRCVSSSTCAAFCHLPVGLKGAPSQEEVGFPHLLRESIWGIAPEKSWSLVWHYCRTMVPHWSCPCLPGQERRWPHATKPLAPSHGSPGQACGADAPLCRMLSCACVFCSIPTGESQHEGDPGRGHAGHSHNAVCLRGEGASREGSLGHGPGCWPHAGSHPLWAGFAACRTRRLTWSLTSRSP